MLSPDARTLYTAALSPPPGYLFDQALATTFSLDPTTLLTIPVHLALLGHRRGSEMDGIAVLEALRRVTQRTTVYTEEGRIQAPKASHLLYGLLEPIVIEARAPRGGAFHPKLWLLRFVEPDGEGVVLRLLILSRNLTADRSWDLSLQLEGRPTGSYIAANRELGEFVSELPKMAVREVPEPRRAQAAALGDELRRTRWELPPGFDVLGFHVLGRTARRWRPPESKRLAVISPFVSASALVALHESTGEFVALVSRAEELDALDAKPRSLPGQAWVLDDAAESEDGEEVESHDTLGLHAKAYILECGWDTHLIIGSANATSEAIVQGNNVEILAELVGKRSKMKGIEALLGQEGLGAVLTPYKPPESPAETDLAEQQAEAALEEARRDLVSAGLRVCSDRAENGWRLTLRVDRTLNLAGISQIRAWPLTVTDGQAVDAIGLATGTCLDLGRFAAASVTGLTAFELTAEVMPKKLRFALNLPLLGAPEDREAAIIRTVIRNRDGFLRYLLLLLGDLGEDLIPPDLGGQGTGAFGRWTRGAASDLPLLEELTRAFARQPERLREVDRLVKRLSAPADGESVIPPEFLELWDVFSNAMPVRSNDSQAL